MSEAAAAFGAAMAAFGPAPPVVALGVSGGPDSMALALLAQAWAPPRTALLALVCDHGLRTGSSAEAQGVAGLLAARGIPARILSLALPPGPALQERARAARHAALLRAAFEGAAPWLLLGHHLHDQAETVLLRARHGSGRAGLAGMARCRAAPQALVLRPMLGMAPAALDAVCAAAGVAPVHDPSNADLRFERVRLRAGLAGHPERAAALARSAAGMAAGHAARHAALGARLARAVTLFPHGAARVDRAALGQDATAEAALAALLRVVGGGLHAPARPAVTALLARGQGTLGGAWWRADGWLLREPGACATPVPAVAGALWDGRFRLDGAWPGCMLGALGEGASALGVSGGRHAGLPAVLRAALPAIRRGDALLAVPHLGIGAPVPGLRFAPVGGPLVG